MLHGEATRINGVLALIIEKEIFSWIAWFEITILWMKGEEIS